MITDSVGFSLLVDYKEHGRHFLLTWNITVIKNDVDMSRKLHSRSLGGQNYNLAFIHNYKRKKINSSISTTDNIRGLKQILIMCHLI